jgi:hypothetical protein
MYLPRETPGSRSILVGILHHRFRAAAGPHRVLGQKLWRGAFTLEYADRNNFERQAQMRSK